MADDLLAGARWDCCTTAPGAATEPAALAELSVRWVRAAVPGTAASALRAVGGSDVARHDYDAEDWWFRCRFAGGGTGPWHLYLGGLATLADVWLNGRHLLHSENMFVPHELALDALPSDNELMIRCGALTERLAVRRPRPRWKTNLVASSNLRWIRTSLLGRLAGWAQTPPIVGPWRPVQLTPAGGGTLVTDRHLCARCDGDDGVLECRLRINSPVGPGGAVLRVVPGGEGTVAADQLDGWRAPLRGEPDGAATVFTGNVRVPHAERWWPHTHGSQPRYHVSVDVAGTVVDLGRVGFRTVTLDRTDGAFAISVNGVPVFCRGAVWFPPDPVSLGTAEVRATLELAREANLNMVRIPATTTYEDSTFWDACDELGLLVWQDCMFAFSDIPADDGFCAGIATELRANLEPLGTRPSLAIVCGNQEVEEVAAMTGLPRERWTFPLFTSTIPALVAQLVPGVPYVASNPTGGDLPFQMDEGVCQYFGVGGYLRPMEDARRAGVRFASECLAFATPPEPATIDEACGGANRASHDPEWKRAVHHDAGRSWDLEDVRAFYVGELFGVDPLHERHRDPERALDLGRAAIASLFAGVFSEWRRPASSCDGALLLALRDLRPGAGWGIIDALGRPKAPWFVLRQVFQPITVLLTDEGLNGLRAHLVNDTAAPFSGTLRAELFARGELRIDAGECEVCLPARGAQVVDIGALFDGFRDVSYAYRFAAPPHDVVVATLLDAHDGPSPAGAHPDTDRRAVRAQVVHLPLGPQRALEPDLGLTAVARRDAVGWLVTVTTRRLAEFVAFDVPGFRPSDSWFHLPPGSCREVRLIPLGAESPERPRGRVRALNSTAAPSLTLEVVD